MEVLAAGEVCLPEVQQQDDSLELMASELQLPLDLLLLSAEELTEELKNSHGDPLEISAAETLLHSAVKMRRIILALIETTRAEHP